MYLVSPSHGVPGLTELLPHRDTVQNKVQYIGSSAVFLEEAKDKDLRLRAAAAAIIKKVDAR